MVYESILTSGVGWVPPVPGGLWAKTASVFYEGPSLGTYRRGNAAQKIIEMFLIEHLGSRRSGESRGGNEIGSRFALEKKSIPLGLWMVHSYVN